MSECINFVGFQVNLILSVTRYIKHSRCVFMYYTIFEFNK